MLTQCNTDDHKKLFNALLRNPTVIDNRNTSLISPLHKKGSKHDPDNYRGISLLSCFSKFFLAILNQRITKFAVENKLFSKAELGFLPGNRTSDSLFILYNLIDYYCSKLKRNIFGCFVDFQKAFDSVLRSILFSKLLSKGINWKFYDLLCKLYEGDKSCIKIGNSITKTFNSTREVKQGCILIPILFNIFLSDLQSGVEHAECEPIAIDTTSKLGC